MAYLWLAVTADKYELPLYVADTAKELGQHLGIKLNTVLIESTNKYNSSRKAQERKIIKVKVEKEFLKC